MNIPKPGPHLYPREDQEQSAYEAIDAEIDSQQNGIDNYRENESRLFTHEIVDDGLRGRVVFVGRNHDFALARTDDGQKVFFFLNNGGDSSHLKIELGIGGTSEEEDARLGQFLKYKYSRNNQEDLANGSKVVLYDIQETDKGLAAGTYFTPTGHMELLRTVAENAERFPVGIHYGKNPLSGEGSAIFSKVVLARGLVPSDKILGIYPSSEARDRYIERVGRTPLGVIPSTVIDLLGYVIQTRLPVAKNREQFVTDIVATVNNQESKVVSLIDKMTAIEDGTILDALRAVKFDVDSKGSGQLQWGNIQLEVRYNRVISSLNSLDKKELDDTLTTGEQYLLMEVVMIYESQYNEGTSAPMIGWSPEYIRQRLAERYHGLLARKSKEIESGLSIIEDTAEFGHPDLADLPIDELRVSMQKALGLVRRYTNVYGNEHLRLDKE